MTIKSLNKFSEDALLQSKEIINFFKRLEIIESNYSLELNKLTKDFQSVFQTKKREKVNLKDMIVPIRIMRRKSMNGDEEERLLYDGLNTSLWAAVNSMVEDSQQNARKHAMRVIKYRENIRGPFEEYVKVMDQQIKENLDKGRKLENEMKSESAKKEEQFFAEETAKILQSFASIEEVRHSVIKKLIQEYCKLKEDDVEITASQSKILSVAIQNIDSQEDLQDFIEDHIASNNKSIKLTDFSKTGLLEKGGELGTEWKLRKFSLKSEQKKLYYFKSDGLKMKGVIDLTKHIVYDVHESFCSKRNCFKIASIECSPNYPEKSLLLSAESEEEKISWMKALSVLCADSSISDEICCARFGIIAKDRPNLIRSFKFQVVEGRFAGSTGIAANFNTRNLNLFCDISFGGVNVAKTSIQLDILSPEMMPKPYIFKDIQKNINTMNLVVFHRRPGIGSKSIEIGKATIPIASNQGNIHGQWFELFPASVSTPIKGAVKVMSTVEHTKILPLKDYASFWKHLVGNDRSFFEVFGKVLSNQTDEIAFAMADILEGTGGLSMLCTFLEDNLGREIRKSESSLIFRSNNANTKLVEVFLKRCGKGYLRIVLTSVVMDIYTEPNSLEIDPGRVEGSTLSANEERLAHYIKLLWSSIEASHDHCPRDIRELFRYLMQHAQYYSRDEGFKYRVVSSFFFLRFVVPAIATPQVFDILKDAPAPHCSRTLTLIAKSLILISNETKKEKDDFMDSFVSRHLSPHIDMRAFIDKLVQPSESKKSVPSQLSLEISAPLAEVHSILDQNLEKLEKANEELQSVSLKEIISSVKEVTQKLHIFDAAIAPYVTSPLLGTKQQHGTKITDASPISPALSLPLPLVDEDLTLYFESNESFMVFDDAIDGKLFSKVN